MNHLTARWIAGGDLRGSAYDRIMAVVIEDHHGCWLFGGSRKRTGYAMVWDSGRPRLAHRIMYELSHGPIPDGLCIDHLCRVRACVNPAHMEVVTKRENVLRGVGHSAQNARKTHCPHGHEYTPENTYRYGRSRHCRACMKNRDRSRWPRR